MKGSGQALSATDLIGSGEASGKPQFEARFNLARKFGSASWNGYVVYHVDNKDMNGVGVSGGDLNGWGIETGHNVTAGETTGDGRYHFVPQPRPTIWPNNTGAGCHPPAPPPTRRP